MAKFQRAILHTAGKTDEQIRKAFGNFQPSQKEIDMARAAYDAWDGLECLVYESDQNEYGYAAPFTDVGVQQAKNAIYQMEQDVVFGTYINMREEFDADFDSGNYAPAGELVFSKDDVEIVE